MRVATASSLLKKISDYDFAAIKNSLMQVLDLFEITIS